MGSHFRPSPDVVAQRVGDEIVLVNLTTDRIFALNRTGARLWDLLSETSNRAEVCQQLLAEFDVTEARLDEEVGALLAELQRERFIEPDT